MLGVYASMVLCITHTCMRVCAWLWVVACRALVELLWCLNRALGTWLEAVEQEVIRS
jgi:hypothetical protein